MGFDLHQHQATRASAGNPGGHILPKIRVRLRNTYIYIYADMFYYIMLYYMVLYCYYEYAIYKPVQLLEGARADLGKAVNDMLTVAVHNASSTAPRS